MQGIIDTGESSCWIVGKDEFDLDEDIFHELKIKTGYIIIFLTVNTNVYKYFSYTNV